MKLFYKTSLVLFLSFMGLSSLKAYDFGFDGIYYNLLNENNVEVTSSPDSYEGEVNIPAIVEWENVEYNVTTIGNGAFADCQGLNSVVISNGISVIGPKAFYGDSSLSEIIIPESVNEIGEMAFFECSSLGSVDLPGSISTIAPQTFYGCFSLNKIELPASLIVIGEGAFEASGLVNITIPDSVTTIEEDAVAYCESLTTCYIGASVSFIGEGAFSYNSSLSSIEVDPNNQYYASLDGVLYNKDLTQLILCPPAKDDLDIPDSVTEIANNAFKGCIYLDSVILPKQIKVIGAYAFSYCTSLKSVTIPEGVTYIGIYAFDTCRSLKSIIIPDSVTSIGDNAFWFCGLKSVVIGNGLEKMGDQVFSECYNLETLVIGESFKTGGQDCFYMCESLKSVTCRAKKVPQIGSDFFTLISDKAVLYVYEDVMGAYKSSEWGQYFHLISPISEDSGVETIGDNNSNFKVYNLTGMKVLETESKDEVNNLPSGLYIINGEKVMIGK